MERSVVDDDGTPEQTLETAHGRLSSDSGAAVELGRRVRDPVCGRIVRPGMKRRQYMYADETYYFDSALCLERFAEQPEVFLSHPGEEGKKAQFDRAIRPELFRHRGELPADAHVTFEQGRVESGSG